ncbi:MAG TPA: ABC transporter permease [Patescibacteria group bacterium]|jgi:lipopolysaccharide transport system permease protein|nr:ABC transporter permease [Patescibacteria group bacterium]
MKGSTESPEVDMMPGQDLLPAAGSQKVVIEATHGLASLKLGLVWEYRELLYFMVWRDIKVRYKQTFLGILWVLLQPLVSIIVFSVLFGYLLAVPSGDVPYPIFLYSALLPWTYFSTSLTRSTTGVVNSSHLITKVYFPRLVIPISGVLSGFIDFAIAFVILIGLMLVYQINPTPNIVFLPGFILLAMLTALAFGLWLSALNVRFRDVNYMLPFLVQVWMYLTPVVYGSNLIPEPYRFLLALNPMTGVVAGFRWALLGDYLADAAPPDELFPISMAITLVVLISGIVFFRTTERTFADII